MSTLPQNPIWQDLLTHFKTLSALHLRDLFKNDSKRFDTFSFNAPHIFLDYSKNRITSKTIKLLTSLTHSVDLENKIDAMFSGKLINTTEHRAALHTALRNFGNQPVEVNGINVMTKIHETLNKMERFVNQVHQKKWLGYTKKPITDFVNIGIGGSDLGPKMAIYALKHYAKTPLRFYFVSNIDGTEITETLKTLNPETTLFNVVSKTFTTTETITNANTARKWLLNKLENPNAIAKHFVAVTANIDGAIEFGINKNNVFEFWDWVGGRYSLWSAVGLSIALCIGMDHFKSFLHGAYEIDEHFRKSNFEQNMPVILALLSIWYRNFFNVSSHAVVPYAHYLYYLPDYLQQLVMESNGKSVKMDGSHVNIETGEIIWGGVGTDGQHAFHQLLHQGTNFVPIDFIIPRRSLNPIDDHHDLLYANCLAQSQALMQGKTFEESYEELIKERHSKKDAKILAPHKMMPGNRPSNTLIIEKISPQSLGALIALYEHKVFVEGAIWNINSFDQWGVELGKKLANEIVPKLKQPNSINAYDASTKGLIDYYRK